MKRRFFLIGFSLITLMLTCARAQMQIDSSMKRYNHSVPGEKLYIHFDNTIYVPGQTVWYKVYLQSTESVDDISRNVYVDWYDDAGKIINRNISPVANAVSWGNFEIPKNYAGNKLNVVAYTKWMLNFDSAFLFKKTMEVTGPASISNDYTAIPSKISLQFFPEGGELVENISSVIAFNAVNSAGMPVTVKDISLKNKEDQEIAVFSTEHDGMGSFKITPVHGEAYTAEWKDPAGNLHRTKLPDVKTNGLVLTISSQKRSGRQLFSIERPEILDERFRHITIVATMQQQVVFKAAANFENKTTIIGSLPVTSFGSGILQVTVFDNGQHPVAERIVFVNNNDFRVQADLITDTLNLTKHGKNQYSIHLSDTMPASLSVSVTDGRASSDSCHNIISHMLLSSEIKGYVHNPAYYFSSTDDSVVNQLDLVMLTHGWRKFVWGQVLADKMPALDYAKDTGYLSISGKIDGVSGKRIAKTETMNLILLAKDSTKRFIFSPLDSDGRFHENNLILYDTTKIYYQLNKTIGESTHQVNISTEFLSFDSTRKIPANQFFLQDTTGLALAQRTAEEEKQMEELQKNNVLKEVVVNTTAKTRTEKLDDRYTKNTMFKRTLAHSFNVVDDPFGPNATNVLSYLYTKVAGLKVDNPFSYAPNVTYRGGEPAFFLDEVQVDASTLSSISMNTIAYIKVFEISFPLVRNGANGAIAVYTKKGEDAVGIFNGLSSILLPGYTAIKQFYSPNYGEMQLEKDQQDFRRTLYWQPNLKYDGVNKNIPFSFYNNDISHSLRVIIEGMSLDGRWIHISKLLR
jgi:hypothetical protein